MDSNKEVYTIDGRVLYEFNVGSGELSVGTNKKGLENLLKFIGSISKEGINLNVALPHGLVIFNGVKKITRNGRPVSPPVFMSSTKDRLKYIFGDGQGSLLCTVVQYR